MKKVNLWILYGPLFTGAISPSPISKVHRDVAASSQLPCSSLWALTTVFGWPAEPAVEQSLVVVA